MLEEKAGQLAEQLTKCPVVSVSINTLLPADSPRTEGEQTDQVQLLIESGTTFPPIIVHRPTMRVIDGMHRLRAAIARGDHSIEARLLDVAPEDAFIVAVELNVRHGLPLSLADRKAAVSRIVTSHPDWSDRAIAAITGLSARSVKAVRAAGQQATMDTGHEPARIGRDGRVRPLTSATGRRHAAGLLTQNPNASLRVVAKATGLAPSTVMNVRDRLRRGEDPVPGAQDRSKKRTGSVHDMADFQLNKTLTIAGQNAGWDHTLQRLRNDPSLRFREMGRVLLSWLGSTPKTEVMHTLPAVVPAYNIEGVLQVAQANMALWQQFAEMLKERLVEEDPVLPRTGEL
ncbi:ParB/RepB/Spo0J family partition protein [Winogradskya humida]|uniref:ParB-like N-terminal domain-containing protein n=1 Tax=Winogradskya humida TaxID=113566 RepID=A0ABQ4A107_9ACTN|nr:ParB/RepB/Spo0J family partition protein [Actinoplanes humidus]GIE24529.1 hypothetical protein Ahu01nite_076310 [Actinoplanes humidus]